MAELVELHHSTHADLKVRQDTIMEIATTQHVMNLRAGEVARAACDFPVFFSRNPDNDRWAMSAISSLEPGKNLFVADGQWQALYQPTVMQTFPLFLIQADNDKGFAVGFDAQSSALSQDQGEPLFDPSGEPSPYLKQVSSILEADIERDLQTVRFAEHLHELKLIRPIDLLVQHADGNGRNLTGLYSIDEDALKALDQEQTYDLHQRGYLGVIDAMLISLFQLNALVRKNNEDEQLKAIGQVKIQTAAEGDGKTQASA